MSNRKELCDLSHKYFQRMCRKRRMQHDVEDEVDKKNAVCVNVNNIITENSFHSKLTECQGITSDNHENLFSRPGLIDIEDFNLKPDNQSFGTAGLHALSQSAFPEVPENKFFQQSLANWAVDYGITQVATTALLLLLKTHACHEGLPKTAKTLLSTPRKNSVSPMSPGSYCHFGLIDGIRQFLDSSGHTVNASIKLQISTDGLPIAQSTANQFWPILGRIVPSSYIFCIGCFFGKGKPASANDFLRLFVDEAKGLVKDGVTHKDVTYNFEIHSIICDAPAKAFVCQTKGHAGYSSCTKCTIEGKYEKNRLTFPEIDHPKRTDQTFREQRDTAFHNGTSILLEIPNIGLVSKVPLEYMHLCCIGVMKKMIRLWLKGPIRKGVRLPNAAVKQISQLLLSLRSCVPVEFARKPREMYDIAYWKATELRLFMLYIGIVVMKNYLPRKLYRHFLKLHIALRLLSKPTATNIDYAESLLKKFVSSFGTYYGSEFLSHNVHGLIHIADDVRELGPLDSYSAFPFENYLGKMKKMLRKGDKPLEQLNNRFVERSRCEARKNALKIYPVLKEKRTGGPMLTRYPAAEEYCKIVLKKFTITTKMADNCCGMKDGSIVRVENILSSENGITIIGRSYKKKTDFYKKPCESSSVDTFKVDELSPLMSWGINHVEKKYIAIPSKSSVVAIALIHA